MRNIKSLPGKAIIYMHPIELKSAPSVALTPVTPAPGFSATWATSAAWVVSINSWAFFPLVAEVCGPLGNIAECGLSELRPAACLRVGLRGCEGAKGADARFLFSNPVVVARRGTPSKIMASLLPE